MTSSRYKLNYEEQQTLKQQAMASVRVQRLKEVRAQDRELSKQRARAYQDLCVDSAQQLQDKLIRLIIKQREEELACLQARFAEAQAGLASAQRQATETEQQLAEKARAQMHLNGQQQEATRKRFDAALLRVRHARESELRAVLDRLQLRQQVMSKERDKARNFTEHARQAATCLAADKRELDLQEELRRRQNQVSHIDFRYTRLHELGVPQLVVNHKELPGQTADAASKAQIEYVRLQKQQHVDARQQEENAQRAADRGASAQKLLLVQHKQARMEQALQELESNQVQQRKDNLSSDTFAAAPLLRKWNKQKLQAKARRAFERDFLPGPAEASQQGLPSFITLAEDATSQQQQHEQQQPHGRATSGAAAADRAMKLVQQLERQRRADAAAADQLQAKQRSQSQGPASVSTEDTELTVDDLITFIPPVQPSGSSHQQPPTPQLAHLASAAAAPVSAPAAAVEAQGSAVEVPSVMAGPSSIDVHVSDDMDDSSVLSPVHQAAGSPRPARMTRTRLTALPDHHEQHQDLADLLQEGNQATDVSTAADRQSEEYATSSRPPIPASAMSIQDESVEAAPRVHGSLDSLDAIIAAADEVLRQLPAELQSAAAARAAAASLPVPRPHGAAGGSHGQQQQVEVSDRAATSPPQSSSSEAQPARQLQRTLPALATQSSAEATSILAELRALQQQLNLQVLNPESEDSIFAELSRFDADMEVSAQPQLSQEPSSAMQAATGDGRSHGAVTAVPQPVPARAALGGSSLSLPAVLARARQQLETAAGASPAGGDLEELLDSILNQELPRHTTREELQGPLPSASSPTRPSGRSGRVAAQIPSRLRQSAPEQGGLSDGATLLDQLKALGAELQNMEHPHNDDPTIASSAATSSDQPRGPGAVPLWPPGVARSVDSSSSLTLPTTILQAAAASRPRAPIREGPLSASAAQQHAPAPVDSVTVSAALSDLLHRARELLAGTAATPGSDVISAAVAPSASRNLADRSSLTESTWSLSSSQEASLLTLEHLLRSDDANTQDPVNRSSSTPHGAVATAAHTDRAGSTIEQHGKAAAASAGMEQQSLLSGPSSAMSVPTTILHGMRGAAAEVARTRQSNLPETSAAAETGAAVTGAGAAQLPSSSGRPGDLFTDLQSLLSLSAKSSTQDIGSSTSDSQLVAGGTEQLMPVQEPTITGVSSSAVSSMSDGELEQLLQRALGTSGFATDAAGGAAGSSLGPGEYTVLLEEALQAMLADTQEVGSLSAAMPPDQASMSMTLPSTIMRSMPAETLTTRQQAEEALDQPEMHAGVATTAAAAAALSRAKRSTRARAASSASQESSQVSSGSGNNTDALPSNEGDTGSSRGSSGSDNGLSESISVPPTVADMSRPSRAGLLQDGMGAEADRTVATRGGSSSQSSSSMLAQHSAPRRTAAAISVTPQVPEQSRPAAVTSSHTAAAPRSLPQPGADSGRAQGALYLMPIQEGDDASVSSASELLGASAQGIDALLAQLANEQQPARQTGYAATSSSLRDPGSSHLPHHQRAVHVAPSTDSSGSAGVEGGGSDGGSSSSRQDALSSETFSDVVSSLMLHIDSTIASLAAGSGGGSTHAHHAAAANTLTVGSAHPAADAGDSSSRWQQSPQQLQVGSAAINTDRASQHLGLLHSTTDTPGGDGSSSSAGLSTAAPSSSDGDGSPAWDSSTDNSTQQYVQRVLRGLMAPSTAATSTTAPLQSPTLDTATSRQQLEASSSTRQRAQQVLQHSSAAAPPPASAVTASGSSLSDSRELEQLLAGISTGPGSTESTSDSTSDQGLQALPAAAAAGYAGLEGSRAASASERASARQLTRHATGQQVFDLPGLEHAGALEAVSAGLRTAVETRSRPVVSAGGLLSPDDSSSSIGTRQQPRAPGMAISEFVDPAVASAAGPSSTTAISQQQQQQQPDMVNRPEGLAALLSEIVADDPVLAGQLQQQRLGRRT